VYDGSGDHFCLANDSGWTSDWYPNHLVSRVSDPDIAGMFRSHADFAARNQERLKALI
jgi:hypothetical protein